MASPATELPFRPPPPPTPTPPTSNHIDLTLDDDEPQTRARQIKRPRTTQSAIDLSQSQSPTPSLLTPSPSPSFAPSLTPKRPEQPVASTSRSQLVLPNLQSPTSYRPHFAGPSNSSAFFPDRVRPSNSQGVQRHEASTSSFLAVKSPKEAPNGSPSKQVIDLTSSPSPPPPQSSSSALATQPQSQSQQQQQQQQQPEQSISPKTPVCIGQLTVTALVLYPVAYLSAQNPTNAFVGQAEFAPVKLFYDPKAKLRSQAGDETINIQTPTVKSPTGEVIPGETFGIMEQKVANVLGPLLGKGLIRLDAKVRRGVPNLPILPLQMLIHTPYGNIVIVSRYFTQHGLLLDHPSSAWDQNRLAQMLYQNPHNPPPGGFAQAQGRTGYARPGGNQWNAPQVNGKSVEVQRSQVDEVFKILQSGEELEETEAGPEIASKLYPHQKKALTFLLERERETIPSSGKPSSLWQKRRDAISGEECWFNIVTQREVHEEPVDNKGALLADDMGLGKTITCVSLIAATLKSAQNFARMPLPPLPKPALEHSLSTPSLSPSHFTGSVWGMPDPTEEVLSLKKKAKKQKEQDRMDAQYARARRIKVRSRGTLIICPLSTVANWEDQFKEHWAGDVEVVGGTGSCCNAPAGTQQAGQMTLAQSSLNLGAGDVLGSSKKSTKGVSCLKVYVYHGNARRPDPAYLADFDAVITTYSTLATEYSKQMRSMVALLGDGEDDSSNAGDDEFNGGDGTMDVDESGNGMIQLSKPKDKKGIKRKKASSAFTGVEASSPLQSVHWFRVVLDEAHSIKEVSTVGSRASCDLQADRRLCLTGTPVQNKLDDVFALIKFIRLNPFDDRTTWQDFIGTPVKFGQPMGVARLQMIMKCITLRRTKESKAQNGQKILSLPPRSDELRYLKFDAHEQGIYDRFFKESREEFNEMSNKNELMKNYVGILQKILRLRQICDHFELVEGKELAGAAIDYEEIISAIVRDGITQARAEAIFGLIRDSGTAQCVECGCELGTPTDATMSADGMDGEPNTAKKGRKVKPIPSSSRGPTRANSPASPRIVMSRCQHIFCICCFKSCVHPGWPNVFHELARSCSVCQTALRACDAVEVSPDCTNVSTCSQETPAGKKKAAGKKEKRQKGITMEDFHPSTKVKALLSDLITFSRMNPYSTNYDPESIEFQMVDESGNDVGDGVVKTVVFSQWTTMLDKVEDALELSGIRYDRLDGTMKRDERSRAMDALKFDPGCEVLLVSLRAGGVGLNLTAAQRVYLMDPYWNPAVENQAVDRIHRLGQTKPVTTIKLIIENTIEDRLLEVQKKKTALANMTLGQHLSKAELQQRRIEELNQLFDG